MALTTLQDLKAALKITGTAEDDALALYQSGAEAAIRSWLGQNVEQQTYTEYPDSRGTRWLLLKQGPVQSVTSVHVDPERLYPASTLLTVSTDYALQSGRLMRLGGLVWPMTVENTWGLLANTYRPAIAGVKVVYVAGYATVPDDIVLAVHLVVAHIRTIAGRGAALQSESHSTPAGSYSYSIGTLPPDVLAVVKPLLAKYRRVVV